MKWNAISGAEETGHVETRNCLEGKGNAVVVAVDVGWRRGGWLLLMAMVGEKQKPTMTEYRGRRNGRR
jgi:hypothetical protein